MFRIAFCRSALVLAVLLAAAPAAASGDSVKTGRSGQSYHWSAGSC